MNKAPLTILKIDSSARRAESVSRQLSTEVVDRLSRDHAQSRVIARDLSAGLPVVTEQWVAANFTPKDDRTPAQADALSQSDELVTELNAADILVIGMPIYNFGVPAALKSWIDLITRSGETFRYGKDGPEGLLRGKRAIVTVASGGVPVGAPMDHATPYLTYVLNFIGITDIKFVAATGLAMDPETPLKTAQSQIAALNTSLPAAA